MSRARDFADLAGSADAGGLTGRNLIINGAMQVAQRGTSASSLSSGDAYSTVDRFMRRITTSGTWTQSQSTDVPSGQGFGSSLKMDCTTANSSLSATSDLQIQYRFESQDLQHLNYGSSSAKKMTLSFWVKATKTGTNIVRLYQDDGNDQIAKAYTVNASDTWEYKTVTFEGNTAASIADDNTRGLIVIWQLVAGSNKTSGTLQTSWGSFVAANEAVGQVNNADSTSNNWLITGVQLEVGEKATPFEHRSYGDELRRCQRYYARYASENSYACFGSGFGRSATRAIVYFKYPQEMRARPSVSESNTGVFDNGTVQDITSMQDLESTLSCGSINLNVASGLTATQAAIWIGNNNSSAYVDLDAEL